VLVNISEFKQIADSTGRVNFLVQEGVKTDRTEFDFATAEALIPPRK